MAEVMAITIADALTAGGGNAYCSLSAVSAKDKAKLYNVMSNPAHKVGDYINKQIRVKDIYVEAVEITDEDTNETVVAPRIVLVDVDGDSYQAVSKGVFSSLSRMIKVFGEPTWDGGIPCVVKQVSLGKNQMLTLEVDESQL